MERLNRLQSKALRLVEKPGVYLMKDKSNQVIYVGKAKVLKKRVSSYFRKNAAHDDKVQKMVSMVEDFDFIVTDSEFEALVLECSLIKQYSPKYNILLKDDKGYHYIKISDEDYPRITAVKQKDETGRYIGPYTSSFVVKQAVEDANKAFMLPTCSRKFGGRKSRPCLNYHIKRCAGVCNGSVVKEDYQNTVSQAVAYLKNGSAKSILQLEQEMEQAAASLNYEQAMRLRDRIRAIQKVHENQKIVLENQSDLDVIGLARSETTACVVVLKFRDGHLVDKDDYIFHDVYDSTKLRSDFVARYYSHSADFPKTVYLDGAVEDFPLLGQYVTQQAKQTVTLHSPKKAQGAHLLQMAVSNAAEQLSYVVEKRGREIIALDQLASSLGLKTPPHRIEAYDISNLKDSGMVGGMVVFENGLPCKKDYKRFQIKTTLSQDDYASMREVLSRRFAHLSDDDSSNNGFSKTPDLILLDGGKGHLQAVSSVLEQFQLSVPCFGMVKDSKHRTRAIASSGGEISLTAHKSAFSLVTRIQDEVHRYTISYQKKVRKKSMTQMELTKITGIGEKKALTLMRHFKSKKNLQAATPEALARVAKVSDAKGQEIFDLLKML